MKTRLKCYIGWALVTVGLIWIVIFAITPIYHVKPFEGRYSLLHFDKPVASEVVNQLIADFSEVMQKQPCPSRKVVLIPTGMMVTGFLLLLSVKRNE